ncbi:MAG: orotidine-5'-phosphate decarboxylase [Candidatus Magasanikbacteria bacterium CG10_big_fil_rev_8_21_14_0_10_47_10]|uniref:Orotidine 5'-phosphate decarboxylase n=1 Tax=Candidatus Magasanikbacteria bacterium CG10_big_fil_rev_8_21_14_0_10_47_10 TaxID=1974652 RepID=A0A2H0TQ99_9BACT|nr:MAG: orotidine-5'-phosphate decarboxylase [Candidatus Magasanikbacteria bacterium CG10_big_fil_rev_8_21_14_0_10_47_10]
MKTYAERAALCTNPTAKALFTLMEEQQTNLCLSADIIEKEKFLALVDAVGPSVCVVKTHIDMMDDFDTTTIVQLQRLAEKHAFLIFEDRKFADIGNTVKHQYQNGMYNIADWAHIINAHALPGPGAIEGLKEVGLHKGRGLLLIAQMSPVGNLATDGYTDKTVQMGKEQSDFVIGFISNEKLTDDERFVHMTPGVKLEAGADGLGQVYKTPASVIKDHGSDVIIVGRGIYEADNPTQAAIAYRDAGWDAYRARLKA